MGVFFAIFSDIRNILLILVLLTHFDGLSLQVYAGIKHFKYIEPFSYHCCICGGVPDQPLRLQCSEQHVFCRPCLNDKNTFQTCTAHSVRCPECCSLTEVAVEDIEEVVATLQVFCKSCYELGVYSEHKSCVLRTRNENTEPQSDFMGRILNYTAGAGPCSLLPILRKPLTWDDAYQYLHDFVSLKHYKAKREILHHFISNKKKMAQLPVRETADGLYNVVRFFQRQLKMHDPGKVLVIAAVGSGDCIMERLLYERFETGREPKACTDEAFVIIEPGLLMYCSDAYPEKGEYEEYNSEDKLMPCAPGMDYRDVPGLILSKYPNARILFFQTWMPWFQDWFQDLLGDQTANAATIGYIHLGNPRTSGPERFPWLRGFSKIYYPAAGEQAVGFNSYSYDLLGWCLEDGVVNDVSSGEPQPALRTELTLFCRSDYSGLEMLKKDLLLYDNDFLKKSYKSFLRTHQAK